MAAKTKVIEPPVFEVVDQQVLVNVGDEKVVITQAQLAHLEKEIRRARQSV